MDYAKLFSLNDKFALITGGTGGLGSEIAKAFLSSGADTAITGHRAKSAEITSYASELGRKCLVFECDILDENAIIAMMSELPRLDILVNCAGTNILLPAEDYDAASFMDVMNLNIHALHNITREAGKRFMIPQKSGKIVNLSSVKSIIGTDKDYIAYCTSKGALNMYTKQLACEWGKYNINVNAIAPTFVRTQINSFQLDDKSFYDALINRIPLGRIGQKSDIAAAALFLSSPASDFITGQVLCVDGGLTARQ
ncbi:MAG: SDR family oxidoreductase [Synergistaceae bacterium]|nr:SDR family oxidoreductase [Synergistaceae bacterium]